MKIIKLILSLVRRHSLVAAWLLGVGFSTASSGAKFPYYPPGLVGVGGRISPWIVPLTQNATNWLNAHPAVAASIIWEDANGAHPWSNWTAQQQASLVSACNLAQLGSGIVVNDVPPNLDSKGRDTVLSAADAWAYFLASVAQSLAFEMQNGAFYWSIQSYTPDELAILFDSRQMFNYIPPYSFVPQGGYRIDYHLFGAIVPESPETTHYFIINSVRMANTRMGMITQALAWCRDNLNHGYGDVCGENSYTDCVNDWQYYGFAPMARVISGTVEAQYPQWGTNCYTAGCWGTVGFLRAALRVVNIPVAMAQGTAVDGTGHAQAYFMTEGEYLDHGDDPYDGLNYATPPIPQNLLLINAATYNARFGQGPDTPTCYVNHIVCENAIVYCPNELISAYLSDVPNNRTHANGLVFQAFVDEHDCWTVQELETAGLWTNLHNCTGR